MITYNELIESKGATAVSSSQGYSLIFKTYTSATKPSDISRPRSMTCARGYGCVSGDSVGIVFDVNNCNKISIWKDGSEPGELDLRETQAMANGLEDESRRYYKIIYDSYSKRIYIEILSGVGNGRKAEFDLDLESELGGSSSIDPRKAWMAIGGANSGNLGGDSYHIRDFTIVYDLTSSDATELADGPIQLPAAGGLGRLTFQAKNKEGRFRGTGGNTWTVNILEAEDPNTAANTGIVSQVVNLCGGECSSCPTDGDFKICDNEDGTYTIFYIINERGRYRFEGKCTSTNCINKSQFTDITEKVFVRNPEV